MKRSIIATAVLTLGIAGAGVSVADPGPNGKNNRGLCTAYFSGSENGQDHKRKAGPFAALEKAADEADTGNGDGETTEDEVIAFCDATTEAWGNNGGGGNGGGGN